MGLSASVPEKGRQPFRIGGRRALSSRIDKTVFGRVSAGDGFLRLSGGDKAKQRENGF